MDHVEPDDLVKYGLIPEFVGRLPVVAAATQLTVDELVKILSEPKNAIMKQYQEVFRRSDIHLFFHPDALKRVAEIAISKNTGARGLRRILETVLREPLYEFPGTDIKYVVVGGDLTVHSFTEAEVDEAMKESGNQLEN
jgi:ATP-dependent Clp protease ATP-binding subunit ClpX